MAGPKSSKAAGRRRRAAGIAAVRGAVSVDSNRAAEILAATTRLLNALAKANALTPARIVSALFTTTADLDAEFPAHAARRLGWGDVPMLHAREIPVPGSMPRVVRVLLTVRGVTRPLVPVYLGEAARLRPDLFPTPPPRRGGRTRRLAIIGVGQIGASVGLALAGKSGWRRIGWDPNRKTLALASRRGALDEIARSLRGACALADLAVVATPVDAMPGVIRAVAAALPPGAALLDTGSARRGVTDALLEAARRGVRAVGGHPIAGNEGRGAAAASAGLFRGATFALLPVRGRVPEPVRALVRDLGARALQVNPAAHDRALASTSHLPYLIARALYDRGLKFANAGLSGPGFRDMTRLAHSDARIAEAYCRANSAEVERAWRAMSADMERRLRRLRRD
jgi:prephenate dehydrogenase